MKKVSKIIWLVILIITIVLIGVLGYGYSKKIASNNQTSNITENNTENKENAEGTESTEQKNTNNPIATIEVENFGTMKIELYPEYAPETVSNFIALSNRGFYNGLTFHRIVKDFMVQGGDPQGNGQGSAKISNLKDGGEEKEYTIKGEFAANGVKNKLKMEEGVLAMARSDYMQQSPTLEEESYNSGSCQFFIVTKTTPSLDGLYTSFGKVVEGLDVLHKIEAVEVKAAEGAEEGGTSEVSTPVNPPKITSIKVETNGVDYGLPKTLEPFDYTSWMYKQYGIDPNSMGTTTTIE